MLKQKVLKQKETRSRPNRARAPAKRQRLSPVVRKAHILNAAALLIVQQGFLPLPIEALARVAGTSKALIYTYFPTQYEIFNSLLERELQALTIAGLDTASSVQDLDQAVLLCAMLYFEHVAQSGPLLHILITDLYMTGHINRALTQAGDAMLSRLTRTARKTLPLSEQETLAAIEMIAVVPQNAGSLVFYKEVEPSVARQVCRTLVLSSLTTLRAVSSSPDSTCG